MQDLEKSAVCCTAGQTGRMISIAVAVLFIFMSTASNPVFASPPANALATGAITGPPVRICGNASELTGPSTQPPGSIAINASENIRQVISDYPNGTTFWIEPGIHYLGPGIYTQIGIPSYDTLIGAPNAIIDGQHVNDYALTGLGTNVTIEYLTIQNFGAPYASLQEGEVNQDASRGWKVLHSTIRDTDGAGVFDASYNNDSYDCLTQNGQYGFQGAGGSTNITLSHDEISFDSTDNIDDGTPYGCGCSGGGKFWEVSNGIVTDDYVHDNYGTGLWADTDNTGFNYSNDYISNNQGTGLTYEVSYNAKVHHDTFVGNEKAGGVYGSDFAAGAIYISESGSDPYVRSPFNTTFNITNNTFLGNYGGVVLAESPARYCGHATPGTYCDLGAVSLGLDPAICTNATIVDQNPGNTLYWECHWNTRNVHVEDNYMQFNYTESGCSLGARDVCGMEGMFADAIINPEYTWSAVARNVTFFFNNLFDNNTYIGQWLFAPCDQGGMLNYTIWQTDYGQDKGSLFASVPDTPGISLGGDCGNIDIYDTSLNYVPARGASAAFSDYITANSATAQVGYATVGSATNSIGGWQVGMSVGDEEGLYAPNGTMIYWFRIRSYPPNGIMPDTSIGAANTGSPVTPTGIIAYVPVTFTNSQDATLPANSQLAIGVDSGSIVGFNAVAYQQYESCNLDNAEFFFANGTLLDSWMEGSVLNENAANATCASDASANSLADSSNVLYWVRIPASSFLPADTGAPTQNTIYLGWAGTSTDLLSNTVTGEAPQLSCPQPWNTGTGCGSGPNSYGYYDNGAYVFGNYLNFAGTSLPSGTTANLSFGSISAYNGLIMKGGTSYSGQHYNDYLFWIVPSLPAVFEFGGTFTTSPVDSAEAWNQFGSEEDWFNACTPIEIINFGNYYYPNSAASSNSVQVSALEYHC